MEESEFYPEKPFLQKTKVESNWGLTAFSIVLFVGVFLLMFNDQISFVFSLILVLFIHEMGHYIFMKLYKYENVRMLFIPLMGAFVQGNKEKYSQKESFLVVSAGPFPGLYLGVACLIFAALYKQDWLVELSFLFLFLNVINLIPIDPMDGGQLFKLLVNKQRDLFLLIFSLISSIVLIAVGWFIGSWIMVFFGFIMAVKIRSLQRNYIIRKRLDELQVGYISTYDELPNKNYAKIRDVIIEETPALRKFLQISEESNEEVLASHVNSVLIAPVKYDVSILFKITLVIFWVISIILPFFLVLSGFLNFDWYFEKL